MLRYLIRRLLFALLLVFLVSSGAMLLTRLAPGDFTSDLIGTGASPETLARERARLGLDAPILRQYGAWLSRGLRFDLGTSFLYGRPVTELVSERAVNSALLGLTALVLATLVGLPLGVVSGSRRRGMLPSAIRAASIVCLSVPPLLMSLIFVLIAAKTGWLPVGGMSSVDGDASGWAGSVGDFLLHLPLPALALALPMAATFERLQSQAMAGEVGQPYVLAALARGVPAGRLVWRNVLRAAIRPVVSVYGMVIGALLSGSFAVEIVTAWPGLGRLMYDALRARDVYLVSGCAAAGALFLALGSLASDIALVAVDPRIRRE